MAESIPNCLRSISFNVCVPVCRGVESGKDNPKQGHDVEHAFSQGEIARNACGQVLVKGPATQAQCLVHQP